jgi:hypothetical protein
MKKDPNVYMVSDYSATGEGRTVMILITRARPRYDLTDYEVEPSFTEQGYDPGIEKTTPEERALREFSQEFGGYIAMGAETLDRNEFFHRFGNHVPEYLYKMTDPDSENFPPGFHYKSEIHFNFS